MSFRSYFYYIHFQHKSRPQFVEFRGKFLKTKNHSCLVFSSEMVLCLFDKTLFIWFCNSLLLIPNFKYYSSAICSTVSPVHFIIISVERPLAFMLRAVCSFSLRRPCCSPRFSPIRIPFRFPSAIREVRSDAGNSKSSPKAKMPTNHKTPKKNGWAHAQPVFLLLKQCFNKTIRIKGAQILDSLADADIFDRQSQICCNGYRNTAFGRAV